MDQQFDFTGLSPEELQQLTYHAIQSSNKANEAIQQLFGAVKMMAEKLDELDEGYDKLQDVVMNEIIGGVEKLYQQNIHDTELEGLKSQYGSLFDPHMDTVKEIYPDMDLYEELLKEKADYPDGVGFDGRVNEVASMLKSKIDKIRGVSPAVDASLPVEAVAEVPVEEPVVEVPVEDDIASVVKKMKTRKNPMSMA